MKAKEHFPEGVRGRSESPRASVFLGQAFRLELQVQTKLQQIADLRALASHVTSFTGNEPVSHTRDVTGMQNTIAKILEEEESLNARIDRLVDAKREIREVIAQVKNVTYQLILEKRHLCFESWPQIGEEMGHTDRWAQTKHLMALQVVQQILDRRIE